MQCELCFPDENDEDLCCIIKRRRRGVSALLQEELLAELQGVTIFHIDEDGLELTPFILDPHKCANILLMHMELRRHLLDHRCPPVLDGRDHRRLHGTFSKIRSHKYKVANSRVPVHTACIGRCPVAQRCTASNVSIYDPLAQSFTGIFESGSTCNLDAWMAYETRFPTLRA